MSAEWVRLGDCEPGTLVEPVAFQTQWLFTGFVRVDDDGTGETHELSGVGSDEVIHLPADALVYPLTAVRLHPSLRGSDLPGLCAAALAEPGGVTYGRLLDWLAEATGRDPDVAAATWERCAKLVESYRDVDQSGTMPRLSEFIRALGRPAATAAACGRCGGRGTVEQTATTPRDQLIWHGDRALYGTFYCPACGGTGGADTTGEESDASE